MTKHPDSWSLRKRARFSVTETLIGATGRSLHLHPGRVARRGTHHRLDEAHPRHAFGDARHQERGGIGAAAFDTRADLLGEVGVELGEAFDIALGMAGGYARGVGGRVHR